VFEGKTLFFLAGNWTASAAGNDSVVRALLHESVWFVDNSATSSITTYDFQGNF